MSEEYYLSAGKHRDPAEGRCAMEWVAHIAGLEHNDKPACVSHVMRSVMITLNDGLGDEHRQKLRPYLARCIGTVNDGHDAIRYGILERLQQAIRARQIVGMAEGHPHPGYLDGCADLFFGPDGFLERMLPLEPWPLDEIEQRMSRLLAPEPAPYLSLGLAYDQFMMGQFKPSKSWAGLIKQ